MGKPVGPLMDLIWVFYPHPLTITVCVTLITSIFSPRKPTISFNLNVISVLLVSIQISTASHSVSALIFLGKSDSVVDYSAFHGGLARTKILRLSFSNLKHHVPKHNLPDSASQ